MTQNRIDANFQALQARGGKALVPYVTAGYPDLATTGLLLRRLDALGVPLIEIGIPFSDSIADGPVIQGSFHRVLAGGFRVADLFATVRAARPGLSAALVAMVSMSLVRRPGVSEFAQRCAESGFDGLIVPDIPLEESPEVLDAAHKAGLRCIMLVAPTTPDARREQIARASEGFVYQVAVRGITGERDALPDDIAEFVRALRAVSRLPVCVGFGIGTPQQVRAVCDVADGAIVGTAVVRRISEAIDAGHSPDAIAESVTQFVDELWKEVAAA
ncbi:MAG: tryptophan synthase subunit alpha [Phycisphaerae bacterium]|nr:tryptophan synthase subunit alpha [Phycisphaerae bacterium]